MKKQRTFIYNPILIAMLVILNISVLGQIVNTLYIQFVKTPVSLEELNYEEELEGTYVRTPIRMIYGYYAYTTEGEYGDTKSKEYVIDTGSSYYMGLKSDKEDLGWTDALMNATSDYADGEMNMMELKKYQYEITGTIRRIPKETLGYYNKFFENGPADQALPYYLVINEVGRLQAKDIPIIMAFDILASAAFVYIILNEAKRRKGLKAY